MHSVTPSEHRRFVSVVYKSYEKRKQASKKVVIFSIILDNDSSLFCCLLFNVLWSDSFLLITSGASQIASKISLYIKRIADFLHDDQAMVLELCLDSSTLTWLMLRF